MQTLSGIQDRIRKKLNRERLIDTAVQLVAVPSPTGNAGAVLDRLAEILSGDGFQVERPAGGHPQAPAVVVRHASGREGRTLQFNGHVDTVHLPFAPPRVAGDLLTGSGASDMKSGIAAAVEALRVIRDADLLSGGGVLFTAHDLHEAPWGLGQQLDQLIREGVVGDAVMLPEPLCDKLPVVGRGAATWKVWIRRSGPPVHEVMRPPDEPSVIATGAEMIARLQRLQETLDHRSDPLAGKESVFVGQIHSGEIYNQYPQECWLQGTRRWLPGVSRAKVESEFRNLLAELAAATKTVVTCEFDFIRDAFFLDQQDSLVGSFQRAHAAITGDSLRLGPKPFVDDGNSFYGLARVPAITHGPRAGGQHTVNEWVSLTDLVRVVEQYALTAAQYCGANP